MKLDYLNLSKQIEYNSNEHYCSNLLSMVSFKNT